MTRYLLRFDDICPTMRWSTWTHIETILERYDVRPLLAVVPDNKDASLMLEPARADFWEWIRRRQAQGWSIGLHGYQHRYETDHSGLLGIQPRSEFAGLPLSIQKEKLCKGIAVFESQGVRVDAFVAPSHSFDLNTVRALQEVGLCVISDGFSWRPYHYQGLIWIPQQIWRMRSMPFGFWTVCYHPNAMNALAIVQLERDLRLYHSRIVGLETALMWAEGVVADERDRLFCACWQALLRMRLSLKNNFRRRKGKVYE